MYAVIETGGKQYRVEVGTQLEVELLDVEPGTSVAGAAGAPSTALTRLGRSP